MAINPSTNATMSGRVTAADANYPFGSSKDETAPAAGDGTPYFKARADDVFGLMQALLNAAGIVPSGTADNVVTSQYLESLSEIAGGRADNYGESGVADAYILDVRTDQHGPQSYFDGMRIVFTPGNNNAGATTVNVAGLGIKQLRDESDVALVGGELVTTKRATATYSSGTGRFSLTTSALGSSAGSTTFDNTSTGMTASDVQAAIDEGVGANQARVSAAWANWNGTGTVALRDSFNITSITDNGTGDYTANITAALANTSYALSFATGDGVMLSNDAATARTTSAFRVRVINFAAAAIDEEFLEVHVFGDH